MGDDENSADVEMSEVYACILSCSALVARKERLRRAERAFSRCSTPENAQRADRARVDYIEALEGFDHGRLARVQQKLVDLTRRGRGKA